MCNTAHPTAHGTWRRRDVGQSTDTPVSTAAAITAAITVDHCAELTVPVRDVGMSAHVSHRNGEFAGGGGYSAVYPPSTR